jgi:hypothetical protein
LRCFLAHNKPPPSFLPGVPSSILTSVAVSPSHVSPNLIFIPVSGPSRSGRTEISSKVGLLPWDGIDCFTGVTGVFLHPVRSIGSSILLVSGSLFLLCFKCGVYKSNAIPSMTRCIRLTHPLGDLLFWYLYENKAESPIPLVFLFYISLPPICPVLFSLFLPWTRLRSVTKVSFYMVWSARHRGMFDIRFHDGKLLCLWIDLIPNR